MNIRAVRTSDYTSVISVLNVIAFLIGFVSQTYPNEAYIHFIGVHPNYRKSGIAKRLYKTFFETVRQYDSTPSAV